MGNIHTPAVGPPRTTANGCGGPWPTANATGKAVCGTERSRSEPGRKKPGNSWPGGMTGQKQAEHICFECGKVGHIQINCLYKKAKPCIAAAARIQQEENSGTTCDVTPTDDTQEGENPPEDEDTEREYFSLGEEDLPQVTPGEDEYPLSQYNWDNKDNDAGSSFRANALSTPAMGYCVRKSHVVMCDKQVITMTCGPNHKSQSHAIMGDKQDTTMTCDHKSHTNIHLQVGVTTGGKPPLYDHHALSCMGTRLTRSREGNQTLSGYWEINGTRAHCLLDSRCEGVMISPDYVWAMGIPVFKLEHPVVL